MANLMAIPGGGGQLIFLLYFDGSTVVKITGDVPLSLWGRTGGWGGMEKAPPLPPYLGRHSPLCPRGRVGRLAGVLF